MLLPTPRRSVAHDHPRSVAYGSTPPCPAFAGRGGVLGGEVLHRLGSPSLCVSSKGRRPVVALRTVEDAGLLGPGKHPGQEELVRPRRLPLIVDPDTRCLSYPSSPELSKDQSAFPTGGYSIRVGLCAEIAVGDAKCSTARTTFSALGTSSGSAVVQRWCTRSSPGLASLR
jgi:hypothetical protein